MSSNKQANAEVTNDQLAEELKKMAQLSEQTNRHAPANEEPTQDSEEIDEDSDVVSEDIVDDMDEEDVIDEEGDDELPPTMANIFGGASSVRVRVQAKLFINMFAGKSANLPSIIQDDGSFFSVSSPIRKSKAGPTGSPKDPQGLIREQLSQVIAFLGEANSESVVFFGDGEHMTNNVQNMRTYYREGIERLMYAPFDGNTVKVKRKKPAKPNNLDDVSIENAEAQTAPRFVDVSLDNVFTIDDWVCYYSDNGELIISPVFVINVKIPLLLDSSSIFTALMNMTKVIRRTAQASGLDEEDLYLGYTTYVSNFIQQKYVNMLSEMSERKEKPNIVTTASLAEAYEDRDMDVTGIYPSEPENIIKQFMPFGGDVLIMLQ